MCCPPSTDSPPSAVSPQEGWTALHYAALKGHLSLARMLLHQGADVEATTTAGKWAGLVAEEEGKEECFEELCRARGEVSGLSLVCAVYSCPPQPLRRVMRTLCQLHADSHGHRVPGGCPGRSAAPFEGE